MLYDKRWDAKTKSDISALPTLIAWLEKQPPAGEYDYFDCQGRCLLGLYMTACGIEHTFGDGQYSKLHCNGAGRGSCGWGYDIACVTPFTFGAALERARALL